VDGVTFEEYEKNLEANLADLVDNMRLAVGPWKVPQLPVYEY
jgi:hypothetical protein